MYQVPPKKILVTAEGSKFSDYAFSHAFSWTLKFKASLEALYVREPWPVAYMNRVPPRIMEEIQEEVEKNIRVKVGGMANLKVVEGEAGPAINAWIQEYLPDLVVMGTHGRRGLKRSFLGSVTEDVVRHSLAPVLAVKGEYKNIKSILAAVTLSSKDGQVLGAAAHLAQAFGASLTVFHVVPYLSEIMDARRVLQEMTEHVLQEKLLKKIDLKYLVLAGDVTEQITTEAKSHQLLVLTARKKMMFKDIALGTTAERVLRYSAVPVLAIPGPMPIGGKENVQEPIYKKTIA